MKTLLITVAALALTGGAASAQQQGDSSQWQGHKNGQGQSQGQGGHSQGQNQGQSHQVAQPQAKPAQAQQSGGRPDWNAYYKNNPDLQRAYKQNQQSPTYHESIDAFAARHYAEHGKAEGRQVPTVQGGGQGQAQSHPGMHYDQSSGWIPDQRQSRGQGQDRYRSYQRNTTAQRRFRLPEYRWPQGSAYRRFSYGQILPRIFFGQNYWLYDYSNYGLPYPPPGAAWVRYGPDALMIDRSTGEIIEVVYG
ncbi:MAG TPA: RcnB family protein, partial [Caulobacteraceae bacterium]